MKPVTRYNCEHCNKDFRTPDRHYCKFNPELKNCFTCQNLKGWLEDRDWFEYGEPRANYPDCVANPEEAQDRWNIEEIKRLNYNMQCRSWKGKDTPRVEVELHICDKE